MSCNRVDCNHHPMRCPNECKTDPCPVFPKEQAQMLKEKAWCDKEYREKYSVITSGGCASYSSDVSKIYKQMSHDIDNNISKCEELKQIIQNMREING